LKIQQLRAETLSSQAYEAIKDLISKNELLPGQSITIKSMAKPLGISPTPVREAFARLTAKGFLEGKPRKRVRVAKLQRTTSTRSTGLEDFWNRRQRIWWEN